MNAVIRALFERKSVRAFTQEAITEEEKELILESAFQAPTAGNQMLYTILDIQDQKITEALAEVCDHQPFIARAPLVLVFLADCRRWMDAYEAAGAPHREPSVGDLLLACEDALVAAQNSVTAAQSLGIGSCYIGDILENREEVVRLLNLDEAVLPIALVVYGHPDEGQVKRPKPARFSREYIVLKDQYRRLDEKEIREMFQKRSGQKDFDFDSYVRAFCERKYMSGFALEMNRSAAAYIEEFLKN